MFLCALGAIVFTSAPIAMAEESPVQPGVEATHPMNGSWRIDTADSTLRKNLDAAIESVAKEFNLLFRDLVRQKLSGATKLCATYTLNVQAEAVHLSCDDRPSVTLQRDGSPFHTLNEAGEPVRGTVEVQGHTVRVSWKGEAGGRTNEFSLKDDTLVLTAEVRSDRIPTPLSWTVDYNK